VPATTRRGASDNGGGNLRIIDLAGDGKPAVLSNSGHSLSVFVQNAFVADLIFRNGFED